MSWTVGVPACARALLFLACSVARVSSPSFCRFFLPRDAGVDEYIQYIEFCMYSI